jgi:Type IV pilin-like G and H, putative
MKQALPRWVVLASVVGSLGGTGCSGPPVQTEAKLMQKLAGTWHLEKLAASSLQFNAPMAQKRIQTGVQTNGPTGVQTNVQTGGQTNVQTGGQTGIQPNVPTRSAVAAPARRPRLTSLDLIFRPDGQVFALPAGAKPVAMDYEIDVTQDPPRLILHTNDRGSYTVEFSLVGPDELQFHGDDQPRPFLRQPVSLKRQSYATEPPVAVEAAAPDWEDPDEQARRWQRRRPPVKTSRPVVAATVATADPGLGRSDLNRLLQAQVVHFQTHQRFADRLEDLLSPNSLHFDQYRYQIQATSTSQQVLVTAQARQAHLPSFAGLVSFPGSASAKVDRMPTTLLCSTLEPSALPPSLPIAKGEMSCPIGSAKL